MEIIAIQTHARTRSPARTFTHPYLLLYRFSVPLYFLVVHNNDIEFDGYLSPSQNLKFSDIPNGVDGIRAIPTQGLLQILFFFALVELGWMPASQYDGDYGVGWFGKNIKDPEQKANKVSAFVFGYV